MKTILPSLAALALCCSPAFAADKIFRAGAVAVDISPTTFPRIIAGGFLEGKGTKNTDALHARCLVLDDGKTKLAFAIVDTCMMTRQLIDEAKALASKQCGIPVDHLMVSATHTHSAPAAMGCLGTRLDKDYAAWLPGKIAEGIAAAAKNLQPAKIGWASVDDWEHTHNRRWIRQPEKKIVDPFGHATGLANMHPGYLSTDIIGPSGPVDPGLSVLSVQTRDGKPLAVLANYSQHYFGSTPVSADYYGLFCKHVARLLGQPGEGNGPFVCAMSQGTSGDLMWMDYGSPKKTIAADDYAESVAKYAEQALKQVQYRDSVPLAMVEKKLTLNYRVPDEKRLEWARPIAAKIENDVPKNKEEVYAREALILHERQKTELVLQAIRIGELTISTLPNEVYALTGLKLKAQSPGAAHFNIELANGGEGYIPTPEQHVLGGYTTWPARTAGLEVQAEPKIVATLLGALEEATGKKHRTMQDDHGPYAKAVLDAKPAAYWRLNDATGKTARNAVPGGAPARITDGAAWYLPGVGSGTGCGLREKLTPSAFSGPQQINRALHLAGGDVQADVKGLGEHYSIALWFWLGEASGASERSGTLIAGPGGETLGSQQSKDHHAQLVLNGAPSKMEKRADDWHFAVLVRDGEQLRVHVDGDEQPELTAAMPAKSKKTHLRFGEKLQGKLDEIAVFKRALKPAEIAVFWKTSGIAEQRTKETADRERAEKEAAERTQPPKFAAEYNAAIAALKPIVHAPLDAQPKDMTSEAGVQFSTDAFAAINASRIRSRVEKLGSTFSVSLWFRNETPNEAAAVTAYLFSRGPDGDQHAPGDHLGIGGTHRRDLTGRLMVFNGNASNQSVAGQTVIPPGTWNHAVFVRDGKHVRAYLNGETKPEIDAEIEATAPGVREFFLGARCDHFAPLHGQLAQFALFDRALTADEAKQLHVASGQPVGTPAAVPLPKPKMLSAPLSPEESLKKIHVPAGFVVEQLATEPLVLDPVAFDWDERGRLWVVEMADYPLGLDGNGKSGGRVRILEDTDGDGRFDKSTLFADGLNFPNGILCWRDGCLVTAAPDVLFLKDSDGDGKADVRKKLLTGFLEGNQQLRVNSLRWGFDGWVYCANGGHHVNYGKDIAITSTLTGEKIVLGSRDFRFKPDTGEFDPLSGPSQFGRNRDAWGHWFGVQNSYPLWHYVLEDRYLRRNPHVAPPSPRNVLTGSNPPVYAVSGSQKRYHSFSDAGHFTSACAGTPYLDTLLFGAGNVTHSFTCEPVSDLVQHFILEDDGVSFKAHRAESESEPDFFASEDRWCRPVMTRTGPDGALWIADMYRYMIEHPQWLPQNGKDDFLPFYREGDDKGRIYRVLPKDAHPAPLKNLGAMSNADLVTLLESSNGWLRDKAQMLLLWHADKSVVPALAKLAQSSQSAHARAYALSTLDGLGALQPEQIIAAFNDGEAGVREHALRLAETHGDDAVVAAAAKLVEDANAKVRLQLALSLGEWKQPAAGTALAKLALKDADNVTIRGAVISSMVPHLTTLAAQVQDQRVFMEAVLSTALGEKQHDAVLAIAETITTAAKPADEPSLRAFRTLLQALNANHTTLEKLAGEHAAEPRWRDLAQKKSNVVAALKNTPAGNDNAQAFAASVLLADPKEAAGGVAMLGKLLGARFHLEPFAEYVSALTQSSDLRVPDFLMQDWDQRTPAQREPILDAMMSREEWAMNLLGRIQENKVASSSFDAQRQARLLKHPSAKVQKLAAQVFASTASASRAKVLEAFKPALALRGDVAKGKAVFGVTCIACHQLEGVGRALGPDLRSVVQHPPEKLFNSILDPSAIIEPGFTAYFCELKSGETLYGIIASETGGSLTLKLADGSVRNLLRPDVVKLQSSKASLMPDGLEAALTPQSLADLIAYLKVPK